MRISSFFNCLNQILETLGAIVILQIFAYFVRWLDTLMSFPSNFAFCLSG